MLTERGKQAIRFYTGYILTILIIVFGVELYLGTLYARYVIVMTAAIFMGGLLVGNRMEQVWITKKRSQLLSRESRAQSGRLGMAAAGCSTGSESGRRVS